jgi:chitodextrinase
MKNPVYLMVQWLLRFALAMCTLGSPWLWAQTPQTSGQWQNGPDFPYFPTHIHMLPNLTVMLWPGDGVSGDDPRLWDPVSGSVTALSRIGFDPFCSAHTFLPDGRLFVAGGHIDNWVGLPDAAIYNPVNNSWTRQARMNLGRWYPTVTGLPNGDVLVVSGAVDTPNGTNPLPQVWQAATGTWRDLTAAQLSLPIYPYMFVAPNGSVFNAGPEVATRYLNTAGTGAWSFVANRTFNAVRDYGSAVMYAPGKILTVGGSDPPTNTAEVIDLNAATPSWRAVGSMSVARRSMNATMLPDGTVLTTGGTRGPGFNNGSPGMPVLEAELWNPVTESWRLMAAGRLARIYHSTALLLPDARVLVAGGNGLTQTEIFSPPYLFAGARPVISSAPASVNKGQSLFVGTPDAAGIDAVSWIALPSVTHTNNMHQGFFSSTSITQAAGGINIVAPNSLTVPAGHYMVFLLKNGVPSTARVIQLTPQSSSLLSSVSSLAPATATAGGPSFSLTVKGSNFVTASVVRWNGSSRTTTFVNSGQLSAAIAAGDIAAAGTAQITVVNPDTSTSNALSFTTTSSSPPATCTFSNWVQGKQYAAGSIVSYNSKLYIAKFANPGYDPTISTYFWAVYFCSEAPPPPPTCTFSNWVQGQQYAAGSVVSYNSKLYIAKFANPGYDPTISTYFWAVYFCSEAPPPPPTCTFSNWVQGQQYAAGSVVSYNSKLYIAKFANPGYNPTISTYFWAPYAC